MASNNTSMYSFWKQSIAFRLIVKELAFYKNDLEIENFFIVGMLYDIDQIILRSKLLL
jgi:hypothetical protein